MNRAIVTMFTMSAFVLSLAAGALAQQTAPKADAGKAERGAPAKSDKADDKRAAWQNTEGLVESSRLIGMRIKNSQGKDVGEIDQLLVDPKSGKVSHAVIGRGGFAGIGETKLVVSWSDLKMTTESRAEGAAAPGTTTTPGTQARADRGDRMVVTIDEAKLDQAPRYEGRRTAGDRAMPSTSPAASPQTEPKGETDKKDK